MRYSVKSSKKGRKLEWVKLRMDDYVFILVKPFEESGRIFRDLIGAMGSGDKAKFKVNRKVIAEMLEWKERRKLFSSKMLKFKRRAR